MTAAPSKPGEPSSRLVLPAELGRLHLITYSGPAGTFAQRTELTPAQRDIYTTPGLTQPKKIIELAAPTS